MFPLLEGGGVKGMSSSAPPREPARDERTSLPQWLAVGAVTVATFLVVTSEMLPVGVLTSMATGLGISSGATGASLTITGVVSAVTAPVVPRLLGDLDRRAVLAAAMVVLAIGNGLTAIAAAFEMLAVSRVVLGIGMGAVWGMASAVAARLVKPRDVALAVSLAVSGVAAASVLGVPLGTFVGNVLGWRAAFAALAVLALIVAAALRFGLPVLRRPVAVGPEADAGARRSLARPAVISGLVVVVLLVTAHFAAYTYVRPVLEELPRMSANTIALLLLLYGTFGLIGNFAAGAAAGRRPRPTVLLLAAGVAVALTILATFGTNALAAGIAIALWGVAYGGISVGVQLWMAAAAPDRVEHVTGLYVGVFTASIALGAFVGGLILENVGIVTLLRSTAALSLASLVIGLTGPGPQRARVAEAVPTPGDSRTAGPEHASR
ncbi:MFS transporter [Cellulomonas telluris]|uniref:MFS transporter n=1 Tax=Cellulomonas telluris TaxID=2306636 RepID=UPI001CA3CFD5|nr:MFS transporter [Cellulomonas telluris]